MSRLQSLRRGGICGWLGPVRPVVRVIIRAVIWVTVGVTIGVTGGAQSLAAQEYSLRGEAELGLLWVPEVAARGTALLNADHRFAYDWGEFSVQHRLAAVTGSAGLLHQLNQAAVEVWPSDQLTLLGGRFSLPWGMGYLFHPGDALHLLRTPDGNVPGFDGAAVSWALSPDWNLTGVVRLDTAFTAGETAAAAGPTATELVRGFRWAGQASGYLGGVQAEAAGVFQPERVLRPSGSLSVAAGPVVLHAEGAGELIGEETATGPAAGGGGLAGGSLAEPGGAASAMGGGFAAPEILGGYRGWAVAGGGNYALYCGDHTISLVAEYLAAQRWGAEGSADPDFLQQVFSLLEWNWDRRVFLKQSGFIDPDSGDALLMTGVRGSFYDSLELAAEGLSLLAEDELEFVGLRVYTRVFF